MQPSDFIEAKRDCLIRTGGYWAFVPPHLPPQIQWTAELVMALSRADRALGQLAGLGQNIPNPHLLIRPFVRREAVLSSQIEGTQASLSDLLLFEMSPKVELRVPDVREVANYVHALDLGLDRVNTLPMSKRLWLELHTALMSSVRGQDRSPGAWRRVQVWIGPDGTSLGQARFVPTPPGPELEQALNRLEAYLQTPSELPPIVRIAAVHYQFETIHPFLDGNGRIGRLLITLMMCLDRLLPQPLLYLSAYFEKHRQHYYDLLLAVSQKNAWNDWLVFFCQGVCEQAEDAVARTRRLLELKNAYTVQLQQRQTSSLTIKLVESLFERPATTLRAAIKTLNITDVAAQRHINRLLEEGILTEVTGQQRNRVYLAQGVVEAINAPISLTPPT